MLQALKISMIGKEFHILKDEEVWGIFKSGNEEALGFIYRSNISILYKYGNKFSSNGQLVEDCIQDLFLTIWKNRENLSATNSIKLYLLGALRKKLIRYAEKDLRHRQEHQIVDQMSQKWQTGIKTQQGKANLVKPVSKCQNLTLDL